jgi:serine/threonine-protein kinase
MLGTRFGNYVVTGILGKGGMAMVYLAEHREIDRKVAVKVLRRELHEQPDVLGRFINEGRAASSIQHPNTVEVLDMGTTADGLRYITMEHLQGESLGERLFRERRLFVKTAVRFAREAAAGMGAAHIKRIVHRDLKPDNLFIVASGPRATLGERIKVLDFGIAKLRPADTLAAVTTQNGSTVGTPLYMSPEQCRGSRDLDARSDIYALGAVLYEALCGRPPFLSDRPGELLTFHLRRPVTPPSTRRPELPDCLDRIVLRMLEKKPDARYQSMAEVEDALEAAIWSGLASPRAPSRGTPAPAEAASGPSPTPGTP